MACVLFLALASGRAFVPGLCANIGTAPTAQTPVYGADSVVRPLQPCCAQAAARSCTVPIVPRDGRPAGLPLLADCAFCKLAALGAEPLAFVALPLPTASCAAPLLHRPDAPPPCRAHNRLRGRAPPFCFAPA